MKAKRLEAYQVITLNHVLKVARDIKALDKTPGIKDSGDAYAHALGRANGMADDIVNHLEIILGEVNA